MRRIRTGRPVVIGAVVLVLLAACGPGASSPTASVSGAESPGASAGSGAGASSPASGQLAIESPVTGVVIAVDSTGLGSVSGFTLRLADGRTQAFRIGILENGASFPPGHLKEHMVAAAPVRAFFRPEGSDLVVYRLEDGS